MTEQHPITPPPELVQQWYRDADLQFAPYYVFMAHCSAQWGADQELEACCEWLDDVDCDDPQETAKRLRAVRRPKPPSLKEQALNGLEKVESFTLRQLSGVSVFDKYKTHVDNIRRALEQLDD